MGYVLIEICKFCKKEQPCLNLFCIGCNNRNWEIPQTE